MASTSMNTEEEQLEEQQTKRLCNPEGNRWDARRLERSTGIVGAVAPNGLAVETNGLARALYAEQGFPISVEQCRGVDNFRGTILYYYEVTIFSKSPPWVGLSDGAIDGDHVHGGGSPNSYMINRINCRIDGQVFDLVAEGDEPAVGRRNIKVYGCGLLLDPNDDWAVFFTFNGTLLGNKVPITPDPELDHLFPTLEILFEPIEGNFDGPFEYDIDECPGLELD